MGENCEAKPQDNIIKNTALMERVIEFAVEEIGDVVPVVIEIYYQRYPEAVESFKYHGFDKHFRLAAEMVESALDCIMGWVDRRREIEAIISDTVPHHRSLKIPDELMLSMLDVTYEVLLSAVPENETEARQFLQLTVEELAAEIKAA